MKFPVLSSLLLLLGLSSQLSAIERPKAPDADRLDEASASRPVQDQSREAEGGLQEREQAREAAWLGVLSAPADETLSLHLGLESGVVLNYVAEGSPAANARMRRHDIVVEVDGAKIGSQEDLREAIQARAPGEEVTIAVISKGQREDRKVVLGERPVAAPDVAREQDAPPLGNLGLRGWADRIPGLRERMKDLEDRLPRDEELQGQLEKHMKRLEKELRNLDLDQDGGLDFNFKMLEDLPQAGPRGLNLQFKASSSLKFFDNEGSVEMKMKDDAKEVVVRDEDGKVLFKGPWDKPQDKAAAPKEIRERIEDVTEGNRLDLDLKNLPKPEMEFPEREKPDLE